MRAMALTISVQENKTFWDQSWNLAACNKTIIDALTQQNSLLKPVLKGPRQQCVLFYISCSWLCQSTSFQTFIWCKLGAVSESRTIAPVVYMFFLRNRLYLGHTVVTSFFMHFHPPSLCPHSTLSLSPFTFPQ